MATTKPTVEQQEALAWAELKQTLDAIPAEHLCTFFHGSVDERDQLMDTLGLARESWWLLGVLDITDESA